MKKRYLILLLFILATFTGCSINTNNKLSPIGTMPTNKDKQTISDNPITVNSPQSLMDVSLNLFKSIDTTSNNTLISPISISIALAMTANGADNQSAKHFNDFFGTNNIEDTNTQLNTILKNIPESKPNQTFKISNSIWYNTNKNLKVKNDFLTKSKDIYNVEVSGINFSENGKSVEKINNWVSEKTDNMIKEIVKPTDFTNETVMVLANSLLFDFKWQNQYDKSQVIKNNFKGQDGTNKVEFLTSTENSYMSTNEMIGIKKTYEGGRYSFIGILPKNNIQISSFIQDLTSENLNKLLKSETNKKTNVNIPKFTYDYNISLKTSLIKLGLKDEFDENIADFSKMYDLTNVNDNVYINDVFHKTHIELSEAGTKAAAVTAVIMFDTVSMNTDKIETVDFNRPFVYMIYDNESKLPVFMGSVINIK